MGFRSLVVNAITGSNLVCGGISIIFAAQIRFDVAFIFIVLGALFDFFDGMSARLLRVSSSFGVQFDSLSDDITFGLAPSLILFFYLHTTIGWLAIFSLLLAVFSAARLAIFNTDEEQKRYFKGLATPANALFWMGLVLFLSLKRIELGMVGTCGLFVLVLASCYLLVSPIVFFSLKFKNLSWQNNKIRYVFLCGCGVIVIVCSLLSFYLFNRAYLYLSASCIISWYICCNFLFAGQRK